MGQYESRKARAFVINGLLAIGLVAIVGILHGLASALAFAPKDYLPTRSATIYFAGKSHEAITEEAVKEVQLEIYPSLTMGMTAASDAIEKANAEVDKNQSDGIPHFDGESFRGAQERILALRVDLITALRVAKDVNTAQQKLGQVLHTIQDFYSHTNWIDRGFFFVNDQLGVEGVTTITGTASRESNTCNGSYIPIDQGLTSLTSGYFGGEPAQVPPAGYSKCLHGGAKDSLSPAGYGINKDTISTVFTTNVDKHFDAAAVAKLGTKKFLQELIADLTSFERDLLLGGESITIKNVSPVTFWEVFLALDSEVAYSVSLPPGGTWAYPSLPELSSAGEHTIIISGVSSTSATGFVVYNLHLPSHLEFVSYTTNLNSTPTTISGQEFGNRLLLKPVNFGIPERIHTIKIRVVDPR